MRSVAVIPILIASSAGALWAADGPAIYQDRCAMCHDRSVETRAPALPALRQMSAENIVRSLESGLMKQQGSALSAGEKKLVAEFLAAKTIGSGKSDAAAPGICPPSTGAATATLSGPNWNGWSPDLTNARFQPAPIAGLTAVEVPRLKLKWSFAFTGTFIAYGQPSIVGGRVYVPSANRNVYSLDAKTGCWYWQFQAEAPVRTAITVALLDGSKRNAGFFGDQRGNAYAVDVANGELLWKTHVDDHPKAKIVGAPVYYSGRLYVPITAGEEGPQLDQKYACCSARGGLAALDAATGKQIWKTYTIEEEPKPNGVKNQAGTILWGPSGASIWSAPTVDADRKLIYAATGDNFSLPGTKTSDAVIAFDMATGKIKWVKQLTTNDVFNMSCMSGDKREGCPDPNGPDFDFGASPILARMNNGKQMLVASQKSGIVHGLDPDRNGEIVWQTRVGRGGALGGVQWGSAADGKNAYAAVSDITIVANAGRQRSASPAIGGGLHALDLATGAKVWSAPAPVCGDRPNCSPAQSAAVTVIDGVVFSGGVDGRLRGYSTADGKVVWEFDTAQEFKTVNGETARGGAMDGPGPTIAGGMLYAGAGYGAWGGLPGNVLLAFSVDGK
jgi:polyvinyl alcohol dehydrogenase (cytochrome)